MTNNVGANGQSIVTKKSGGVVANFPDVCKTPTPGGPVPIPYPNIAKSSDLAKGSKSVKINGVPACLKDSNFNTSVGDEAGAAKGLISGKIKGIAEPVNYSFNVQIESKSAVRNLDPFVSNNKNTAPVPLIQAPLVPSLGGVASEDEDEKCEFCGKPVHEFAEEWGTHIGSGQTLRPNIIDHIENHRWYTGPNSLQARHLICSEAMDDNDWSEYCRIFGYRINKKNNGVMLPYEMALACQLHAPVHRSNHSKGVADGEPYPRRIKNELEEITKGIRSGKYCDKPKALVDKLDNFSRIVLKKIDKFKWTITADGKDYAADKNGYAGVTSMTKKPNTPCPHARAHGLTKKNETTALSRRSGTLEIGK